MDIIRFAIENPVKTLVGVILVVLFGLVALANIPIQLAPNVDRPMISVRTTWPGRSPEEVEESILLEQEKKLKSVQGLYQMTSTAQLGQAEITLEFNIGVDKGEALQDVSNRINEVEKYPEDVDRPIIRASDAASDNAVGYLLIQSENDPTFDVASFYDHADRFLKPALERIEGVSETDIKGGREHEIQIQIDPVRLSQRGISVASLRQAILADNLNESVGDLASGRQDIRFRVIGRHASLQPIEKTIIRYDDTGNPIRVEDVADVKLTLEKCIHYDQCKGRPSMTIFIKREVGANVLDILAQVREQIEILNGPSGPLRSFLNDRYQLRLRVLTDDSQYIYQALSLVRENLLIGAGLAVVVLLLFLRSFRPTLIISLSIPITIVGSFVVLYVADRNVNIISLAGMSFAVGMVVDAAIVVLENIDRHLKLGEPPAVAAYRGTREVWGAVLSSTLTTVAVFGPVLTIADEAGQLYYDIALAICAAVLLSLAVSVTVIPMLSARLLRSGVKHGRIWHATHSLFGLTYLLEAISAGFSRIIHLLTFQSVSGVWSRILILGVILTGSFWLSSSLMLPASYLPNGNKNVIFTRMSFPAGYSMDQNRLIGERLEDFVRPYWEAENTDQASKVRPLIDPATGKPLENIPAVDEFFFVVVRGRFFAISTSKDPENVRGISDIYNAAMAEIPGARGVSQQPSIFGRGMGGANTVEVEVVGDQMEAIQSSSAALESRLRDDPRFQVRSDPQTYNESGRERRMMIDQVRAKQLGLNVDNVSASVRAFVDGIITGEFNYNGDNIDMRIVRHPSVKIDWDEVPDMPVAVLDKEGKTRIIPLRQLVHVEEADASQSIKRVEQQKAVTLYVTPPPNMALEDAEKLLDTIVHQCRSTGDISPDVIIRLAGNASKLSDVLEALIGKWTGWNVQSLASVGMSRFFFALLVTYLLMAALFESFLYPIVIMLSVPLATVGGFLGLRLVQFVNPEQQMDTMTMLGFVILIGIVVNNAILIVHQALNFMRGIGEGEERLEKRMSPREAIRQSVHTRIRPIFMTTTTSVFGMLPLVLAPGAGSELYRGLGGVVIGGLCCSTLFTLVVVPLMFSLVLDAKAAWLRLRGIPEMPDDAARVDTPGSEADDA